MRNYNNSVVNPTGQAVAGAQIVVTKAATPPGSGAPANVFSDDGITAISNTVVADNLGRFAFFAPDGKYDLTVSGGTPLVSVPYTLAAVEIIDLLEFNTLDQQPVAAQILNFSQVTTGPTPPVGSTNLYAKSTDRNLYYKDALGVETGPLGQGGGSVSSNVALKPMANDNIQYVSPNGKDTNDGLSIGTAKLTVYAALQALPGGSAGVCGNGTVLISGTSSYGGPVANQGMWIMGNGDVNFANPPAGWLKRNNIGPLTLTIDTFAGFNSGVHSHTGRSVMLAGGPSSSTPAVWISAISGNITINNIQFQNYAATYVRYGIDSTGNRTGAGGSQGFAMRNVGWNHGGCGNPGQTGPGLDIGSNCFWLWFKELDITGCPAKTFAITASGAVRSNGVATITTAVPNDIINGELVTIANVPDDSFNGSPFVTVVDNQHFTYPSLGPNTTSGTGQVVTARAAAINIDSGALFGGPSNPAGPGSGLIFIDDTNLSGGNIRYSQGANGGGFYVRNVSYEGTGQGPTGPPDAPIVLITATSSTTNGDGTNIRVDNVEISDPNVTAPGVQVDNAGGVYPDLVIVSRIAGFIRGKMTVLGNASVIASPALPSATYIRQQQYGIRNGQITATGIDVARRGFSPATVRATNLAATNPSAWTMITGNGTITPGFPAPDGTNGAGRVVYTSGIPTAGVSFYYSTALLNLGDTYVFGTWVRSATLNGYASNALPIRFVFSSNGFGVGDACAGPPGTPPGGGIVIGNFAGPVQSDGQWQWYSGICKVVANASQPGTSFIGNVDATHNADFYGPVLHLFPSGTISDNEAAEIALNLASLPSAAAAGEVSMLPGQPFRPGSTNFTALGTPNNGVLIYCTDCAVTNPCSGGGTGALAKRLAGQWVCN